MWRPWLSTALGPTTTFSQTVGCCGFAGWPSTVMLPTEKQVAKLVRPGWRGAAGSDAMLPPVYRPWTRAARFSPSTATGTPAAGPTTTTGSRMRQAGQVALPPIRQGLVQPGAGFCGLGGTVETHWVPWAFQTPSNLQGV